MVLDKDQDGPRTLYVQKLHMSFLPAPPPERYIKYNVGIKLLFWSLRFERIHRYHHSLNQQRTAIHYFASHKSLNKFHQP
jgi:hypothetical protein